MRIGPVGEGKGRFGFLFGTGVVHGFLAEYYRYGAPSPLVAVKTLARGVGSALVGGGTISRMAKPFQGTVSFDDGTTWTERPFLAVAAGTISHIGLQFKPFYRHAELPGRFHMLGIHASPLSFVRELPRVHRGEPLRPGKALEALAARAIVSGADGTVPHMIDGDLHEARGDLEVAIGPRVKLVVSR